METGYIGKDGTQRDIQPGDCIMAVMGQEGDLKTIWDKDKPEEVENARTTFNNLKVKGYMAPVGTFQSVSRTAPTLALVAASGRP